MALGVGRVPACGQPVGKWYFWPLDQQRSRSEHGGVGDILALMELEAVRWKLDLLASSRLTSPPDPERDRWYEELCGRERELLKQTASERALALDGPVQPPACGRQAGGEAAADWSGRLSA